MKHDLMRVSDLRDTHLGKWVSIGPISGTLVGIQQLGGAAFFQLEIKIGEHRIFTDLLYPEVEIEVFRRVSD